MRRFIAVCTLAAAASVTAYAGDAAAAPLKCVSNDVNVGPAAVTASVMGTDPVQKGHLYAAGLPATASTCAAPTAAPVVIDAATDFHYKSHTFKNRSATAACVEVRYVFSATSGAHETTAYAPAFDPANPSANYLGASGSSEAGGDVRTFSVTVGAMSDFTLVTTWSGAATAGAEPTYDLYVANCGSTVVTAITPNAGPVTGGQAVTISGSGFEGVTPPINAWIGDTWVNAVFVDDSTLMGTTGASAAGTYDVKVTGGDGPAMSVVATLPQAYTYGGIATTDAGATDASAEGGTDAGRDASTGGPTTGGPTQGSSSSSGGSSSGGTNTTADAGDDDDDVDGSTGDGGAKKVSAPTKKKSTGGEEEYVCACNEVGRSTTPGLGAFATMALGILAVLRLRRRK